MADDFTLTDDEVRYVYARGLAPAEAEWDAWLAAHDREVAARALRAAADAWDGGLTGATPVSKWWLRDRADRIEQEAGHADDRS